MAAAVSSEPDHKSRAKAMAAAVSLSAALRFLRSLYLPVKMFPDKR